MTDQNNPEENALKKLWRHIPNWAAVATVLGLFLPFVLNAINSSRKALGVTFLPPASIVSIDPKTVNGLSLVYNGAAVENAQVLQVRIVNTGNVPITEADFEGPVFLKLKSGGLLNAALTDRSPPDLKAALSFDTDNVTIRLGLLNPNDSVELLLVTTSMKQLPIVAARIVGVKSPDISNVTNDDLRRQSITWPESNRWTEVAAVTALVFTGLLLSVGVVLLATEGRQQVFKARAQYEKELNEQFDEDRFWLVVVARAPKEKLGGISPGATLFRETWSKSDEDAEKAVNEWIRLTKGKDSVDALRTSDIVKTIKEGAADLVRERVKETLALYAPRIVRKRFRGVAFEAAIMANRVDRILPAVLSEVTELLEQYGAARRACDISLGAAIASVSLVIMTIVQWSVALRLAWIVAHP